jgi:hypothetical protein
MKMSDVKESFFKKNVGCFTEDDVKSGDYSQQDVLDLLDGYESLLSAFSRYSNNHDRMADEIAELRKENNKLKAMIDNGLGWEDMKGGTIQDVS